MQIERIKLSQKVLYNFSIFVIINELLIIKNRCYISAVYRQIQVHGEMQLYNRPAIEAN